MQRPAVPRCILPATLAPEGIPKATTGLIANPVASILGESIDRSLSRISLHRSESFWMRQTGMIPALPSNPDGTPLTFASIKVTGLTAEQRVGIRHRLRCALRLKMIVRDGRLPMNPSLQELELWLQRTGQGADISAIADTATLTPFQQQMLMMMSSQDPAPSADGEFEAQEEDLGIDPAMLRESAKPFKRSASSSSIMGLMMEQDPFLTTSEFDEETPRSIASTRPPASSTLSQSSSAAFLLPSPTSALINPMLAACQDEYLHQ